MGATDGMTFLGGCCGHVLPTCQKFQSHFWTMVQWEWRLANLFIWQMCFHHSWLDTFIWHWPQMPEISVQNCTACESQQIWSFSFLFWVTLVVWLCGWQYYISQWVGPALWFRIKCPNNYQILYRHSCSSEENPLFGEILVIPDFSTSATSRTKFSPPVK